MKFALPLLFCLSTLSVLSQEPCQIKLSDLPDIRGIKMGMPEKEFRSLLPGATTLWATPNVLRSLPEFKGVYRIIPVFYKDRLSDLSVTYDNSVVWRDVGEFQNVVAEKMKLPNVGWDNQYGLISKLTCQGFDIELTAGRTFSEIQIRDLVAKEAAEKEKKEAEEAKRKAFKP